MIRLVIVEDETIVAKNLEMRIKKLSENLQYDIVVKFVTGEEAIEKIPSLKPDLVLMDVRLKGEVDGIDAAQEILKLHDAPIIFITAYSDYETARKVKEVSSYGFIIKPFDIRQLHFTIDLALNSHSSQRELRQRKRYLENVLESIADAVITTDEKGCVVFMNSIAEKLTGRLQKEVEKKKWVKLFELQDTKGCKLEHTCLREVIETGKQLFAKDYVLNVNQQSFSVDCCISPLKDKEFNMIGAAIVLRDISQYL